MGKSLSILAITISVPDLIGYQSSIITTTNAARFRPLTQNGKEYYRKLLSNNNVNQDNKRNVGTLSQLSPEVGGQ